MCKSFAPCCSQITTPAPYHSAFYRPDAFHDAQPTVSKHWRRVVVMQLTQNLIHTWLWWRRIFNIIRDCFQYYQWLTGWCREMSYWPLCAKKVPPWHLPIILPNADLISKFFTVRLGLRFVIKSSFKIPPHLKYVAVLQHYLVKYLASINSWWPTDWFFGATCTCSVQPRHVTDS